MSLQHDIRDQMKQAMIAKDAVKLNVLRSLVTSFTNENVAKKRKPDEELSDEDVLTVIARAVKQRKDSIDQFEKGGRTDLAEAEKAELSILQSFLPAQMSKDEVLTYVEAKQKELNMDKSKAGQFMGMVMKELKGKADSGDVKEAVEKTLS